MTGSGTLRGFLEPIPEPSPGQPTPQRRAALGMLVLCGLIAAGGIAGIIFGSLDLRRHPVPKPGPRRYPPGYRRPED